MPFSASSHFGIHLPFVLATIIVTMGVASRQHSVFPDNFLFQESINILAMVILGGMGNVFGVILGAAVIVALPEIFRELALYRLLAFGATLMVLMIFRPQVPLAGAAISASRQRRGYGAADAHDRGRGARAMGSQPRIMSTGSVTTRRF